MGTWDMIRMAAAGNMPSYVYHGFSVRLPPQVHALVHDQSLPEHVRGFHLARHLLTRQPGGGDDEYAHTGQQLGADWHRDSYWASVAARSVSHPRDVGRTAYVLKALEPAPEHIDVDENRKAYPIWMRPGAPVHFTGLYWHHPEHQVPGSPHEGDEHELDFPEPITARA